jgi:hypothetical protein
MAKLTESQVAKIRDLGGKMLQREIGAQLGLSARHVGKILRREIWAHV